MRSRFFIGLVVGVVLTGLCVGLASAPLMLTHRSAGALEESAAAVARGFTTRLGSRSAGDNPVASTPRATGNGQTAYNGLCLQCHGSAGRGNGVFGNQTFPPAADLLADNVRDMSDAQIFYVIKNGYGFSSMPGYGDRYSDEMIWSLVNYVRTLQNEQGGRLAVGTPTGQRASAARVPAGGDAQRGALQFRAQGCVNCHGALPGQIALSPQNTSISQTVRNGQPGMPCFSVDRLSDPDLADIIAYIATFPQPSTPAGPIGPIGGARPSAPPSGGGGAAPSQAPNPCNP